jgi:hypothetical protein
VLILPRVVSSAAAQTSSMMSADAAAANSRARRRLYSSRQVPSRMTLRRMGLRQVKPFSLAKMG